MAGYNSALTVLFVTDLLWPGYVMHNNTPKQKRSITLTPWSQVGAQGWQQKADLGEWAGGFGYGINVGMGVVRVMDDNVRDVMRGNAS